MRTIFFFLLVACSLGIFLLSSNVVSAECSLETSDASQFLRDCAGNPPNAVNPEQALTIKELVRNIAQKVIQFGALFAIGAIVFAGIRYTTSYGDDEKIKHAKTTGIYAVIGLLLLGLAFPLVDIVVNFIYTLGK
jgi:hypothetical protein